MATLHPFRALRPDAADAARIAAVPYDVVNTDEARALADGNPLSFLRVSRAEIELPPDTDPYADAVYQRARENFATLRKQSPLVVEAEPSLYFYRLRMGDHEQTGLAACFSLDEYDRDIIKKHERTRRDKEDDRTRHMLALGAQTGPVFLTYRAGCGGRSYGGRAPPPGRADHRLHRGRWRAAHDLARRRRRSRRTRRRGGRDPGALHRRRPPSRGERGSGARRDARARAAAPSLATEPMRRPCWPWHSRTTRCRSCRTTASSRIWPGCRGTRFFWPSASASSSSPGPRRACARRGEIAMYFDGAWHTLRPRASRRDADDPIGSLDVSVLQERLLAPVLKIADVRTDKRIDFVGGARGTKALEQRLVDGRQGRGRLLAVPGQRGRPDGRLRRR